MIKMTAQEVVKRYKGGKLDFQRTDLRGQSFKKFKHLSLAGADFSEADIRGTNFAKTNLSEAKFIGAVGGIQKRWWLWQQLLGVGIGGLFGISSTHFSDIFALFFYPENIANGNASFGITYILLFLTIQLLLAWQGFTVKALYLIFVAVAVAVVTAPVTAVAGSVTVSGIVVGAVVAAGSGIIIGAVAVMGAGTAVATVVATGFVTIIWAIVVSGVGTADAARSVTMCATFSLFSVYIAWQTRQGNEKFSLLRVWINTFGAIGGTSFAGNMTGADFEGAMLKSTNLQNAIITNVHWKNAKLDFSRWGESILANSKLRTLLVSHDGIEKDYQGLNLSGVNLSESNLIGANFKQTDLSRSILCYSNFTNANLTEAIFIGADLTNATLTGACLQGWNIDHSTKLGDVECESVNLLEEPNAFDSLERRPSSGDFAPGEFTKLFQEVLNTVDLIFRDGVDWKAFLTAFQQVQVENGDTQLEIQSIENKGDGVVVVRVKVPPDTDKTKIHSEFNQQYELALVALEAKYRSELKAKDGEIAIYREQSTNMWEAINSLAKRPINVQVSAESKSMNDSIDKSQNVKIDGNVTGSTINLGNISGNVINTINQLPDTTHPNQPNLKELLTQLQAAIEGEKDPSLSDGDKTDLLEEVKNLAEAKQTEEPTQKEGLARKAKKIFDATLTTLPATATLVKASNELLPVILKVLGL
jgi:uncharacterized protein YjbI with pentapeptide repeats